MKEGAYAEIVCGDGGKASGAALRVGILGVGLYQLFCRQFSVRCRD
jgi:hypothetical protein